MNVERIRIVSPYAEREAQRIERDHKKTLLKDAVTLEEDKGRKEHSAKDNTDDLQQEADKGKLPGQPKSETPPQNVDIVA
ncbi:MAG: hypothetical protein K1X79_09745 [Oligoflexia bacterium]|nr:hypothetical protein [Oligoflexia bacterium]